MSICRAETDDSSLEVRLKADATYAPIVVVSGFSRTSPICATISGTRRVDS